MQLTAIARSYSDGRGFIRLVGRVMKLTSILITITFLHAAAAGIAQTVTLDMTNVPIQQVFKEVSRQTGISIVYRETFLKDVQPVTISVKDASVKEVLDLCLKNQPVTYSVENNTIIVTEKNVSASNLSPPAGEFHGRVTNGNGEPLSGANVTIKRTHSGVITNAKGEFTLLGLKEGDIIVVSFVGYKSESVPVKGRTNAEIILELARNELDKVVVQAYGTTTQRLATGNIATVTAAEIEKQPVINPLEALQGRVAGLVVTQTNGYASAPFKVEIRGRNVIGNVPSDPLYIIDGVPLTVLEASNTSSYNTGSVGFTQTGYLSSPARGQSPFFSINPADIESMTVLKDADATAIYGSRGANGVIIISTKKGTVGKTVFDMNVYTGISAVTRHYDLMNTQQYLDMRREAFKNDGITPDPGSAYDLLIWDTTRYTDWQKYLYGNLGRTTDAQMSISGGNKQTTFRLGAGYKHATDITTASGASQRGSLQFNLTHRSLDQKLSVSFSNLYSVAVTNIIKIDGLALLAPNAPPAFDSKGNLNYAGWRPLDDYFPFRQLLQPYDSKTYFLNSRLLLKYEILKGLAFSGNFGYSNATAIQHQEYPIASFNPKDNPKGQASFANNNHVNWIIEPQLEYNTFIGPGKLNVLAGGSIQGTAFDGDVLIGSGFTNDLLLGSISNAPTKNAYDVYERYKYGAVFGRINYNLYDKYILNLSARRDGSSRFGPGKQFGNFYSVAGAWIFSEENWVKNHLAFLSLGKIRGSYGTTGNDQIGEYQYLTRWSGDYAVPYQGNATYLPLQHANPNYQWQVNRKLEIAIDLGFMHDRLDLEVAWYRDRCGNQLISLPLSILTGFNQVTANSQADVQNRGLEITLNGKILEKKDVELNLKLNIGFNRNKLLAFPNLDQSIYQYNVFIGQSLNITQLLHYTGVNAQTGQYTYEDKNKDGSISVNRGPTGDLYLYDLNPKYTGGFGTDFRYRNWHLSLFFHFRKQMGSNAFTNMLPPGWISNVPVEMLNRWTYPGQTAPFARYTTHPVESDYNLAQSNASFTDASFLRLENLSCSYDFPENWIRKVKLKGCRLYIQAQNLFVITKYKGVDPETQNFGSMPPAKIVTGGLQITL